MYYTCGTDFKSIKEYCELHSMTTEEIIESLSIIKMISIGVS